MGEIASLKNLGPKSAALLEASGIVARADLDRLGPVAAFLQVRRHGFRPSLNLLYALAGALAECHWTALPEGERGRLLLELDALDQAERDGGV